MARARDSLRVRGCLGCVNARTERVRRQSYVRLRNRHFHGGSLKFLERVNGVKAIKPRCRFIFGRSDGWNHGQREAYRMLSASRHNLTIMTFDHVLARAKRMLNLDRNDDVASLELAVNGHASDEELPVVIMQPNRRFVHSC